MADYGLEHKSRPQRAQIPHKPFDPELHLLPAEYYVGSTWVEEHTYIVPANPQYSPFIESRVTAMPIAGVTGRVCVGAPDISYACISLTRDAYRDSFLRNN